MLDEQRLPRRMKSEARGTLDPFPVERSIVLELALFRDRALRDRPGCIRESLESPSAGAFEEE